MANRMIDILTAYTSAGLMFAVDTRLRPNGSAGALVQSESAYKAYFEKARGGLGRHHLHEGPRDRG